MGIEVDAEKLRFVTDEGLISFCRLKPPDAPDNFGNWGYTCEIAWDPTQANMSFKNALAELALAVTGKRGVPKGVLQKIEDTTRDMKKNIHLEGKVYSSFKKTVKVKDKNLADPAERKEWLAYVATCSPNLFKLDEKGARHDAKFGDFFSGCFGRVVGHVFYQPEYRKFCITMDHVIRTRKGDRIGGGPIDPDSDPLLNGVAGKAIDDVDQAIMSADELQDLPF